MVIVTSKRVVNNRRDQVWRLFSDIALIGEYHPFVKSVHISSPTNKKRPVGIGTTRHCHFIDGSSTKEEVVQILAKDYLVWRIQQIDPSSMASTAIAAEVSSDITREDDESCYHSPFSSRSSSFSSWPIIKEVIVTYSTVVLSETRTEIRILVSFDMPPDELLPSLPLLSCFNLISLRRMLLQRSMCSHWNHVLEGMDMHLRTGERVDKNDLR